MSAAERNRRYRERHPDRIAAYESRPDVKERKRKHKASWKRRNSETVKPQRAAGMKVLAAVKAGKLAKLPCRVCGKAEVQAHHPNGYRGASALDIVWLCTRHHTDAHGR